MKKLPLLIIAVLLLSLFISSCTNDPSESAQQSGIDDSSTESLENSTESFTTSNTSKSPDTEDVTASVKKYLDIILEDAKAYAGIESELAAEFPDEFAKIIAFGEEAFPALDEIAEDKDADLFHRAFAYYTKYTIKPEMYDLSFPSPDGNYSIKCSVNNFIDAMRMTGGTIAFWLTYDNIRLVDEVSDSVIVVSDIIDTTIDVHWMDNNKYAAISYGFDRYYRITDVFDVQNSAFIKLPDFDEVANALENKFDPYEFDRIEFDFDEWISESKIRIKISTVKLTNEDYYDCGEGYFIYDLALQKILDGDYTAPVTNK